MKYSIVVVISWSPNSQLCLSQVIFVGEEAVDAGGVRKEFFLLIMKELLDPKYGMFRYYEESRLIWFSNKVRT